MAIAMDKNNMIDIDAYGGGKQTVGNLSSSIWGNIIVSAQQWIFFEPKEAPFEIKPASFEIHYMK